MTRRLALGLIAVLAMLARPGAAGSPPPSEVTPELRQRAVEIIRQTLDTEARWVKVHAAEYLLSLDDPEGVTDVFQQELVLWGGNPEVRVGGWKAGRLRFSLYCRDGGEPEYRIGVWRVLARAATSEAQRKAWVDRIRAVFRDRAAPDRAHAAETLAKLGYVVHESDEESLFQHATGDPNATLAIGAAWVLANSGRPERVAKLLEWLGASDAKDRAYAAYALRKLPSLAAEARVSLGAAFEREPAGSSAHAQLACAAAIHAVDAEARQRAIEAVRGHAVGGVERDRYQACETLAAVGAVEDLDDLLALMKDPSANVRATAAYAVLRLDRRSVRGLVWPDWLVIGVYLLAMLTIGWYYSRRVKTGEDYHLGERRMNPVSLGLSLFATLWSTITYLCWPGEMIQNGPMFLAMIAAFPLIYLVAGWLIIPRITRLRVTSAYEILQTRLGLGVRMVGSSLFLLMRLLWMAVILHATTGTVLVPLLGLPPATTPWLCAALAVVTVAYTSMGGLRAVVVTDVAQTVILFGGAIVTLVLVAVRMGGIGDWIPTEWPTQWPEPVWGFSATARVTFLGAVLANFMWWVCTAGSDQMAIQRYLATRDAKAARRVLGTSLWANVLVMLVLAVVGLALLAFFRANPQMIADGKTLLANADELFPRFIACGMPPGLSGLVVAGLLAAAMSSLSSGVNSSCSVLVVDFLGHSRLKPRSEAQGVRAAKWISVLVGVAIVVLSVGVGGVHGNLLEVAYKVVNLLTAPLFGLFFLALFVRWATPPGALVGLVFGLATVVLVNYWKELTGTPGISFLWAMPLGLLVEVAVGMVASLVPWGAGQRTDQ